MELVPVARVESASLGKVKFSLQNTKRSSINQSGKVVLVEAMAGRAAAAAKVNW